MANTTTIARPYAKAILMLAKANNTYALWTNMLRCLADLAQDPLGHKVLSNLAILPVQKAQFICEVAKGALDEQAENLVKLLARNKRLLVLPALYSLYEQMREIAERMVLVDLTLAQDIDPAELSAIKIICTKNFTGQVFLSEQVNPALISGGVAQIGNRVIDASITGRLHAMRKLLRK